MAAKNKEYRITNFGRADRLFRLYRTDIVEKQKNMLDEEVGKVIGVMVEEPQRRFEQHVHVGPNLKGQPPGETTVDGETMQRLLEDEAFQAALEAPDDRVTYEEAN